VQGMAGLNGISIPDVIAMRMGPLAPWVEAQGVTLTAGGGRDFAMTFVWIAALFPIVFLAPNTQQIMQRVKPALDQPDSAPLSFLTWRASTGWALAMALVLGFGLLSLTRPSEFLYFQF
jgi:alginate O-acetyltransferase complex protein AlgI